MIWRLIKIIFIFAILGAIALAIFAYLGPVLMPGAFAPPTQEIHLPIELEPIQ